MGEYVPVEYPKWIGDVLVQNAAEEWAIAATLAKSAPPEPSARLPGASASARPQTPPSLKKTGSAPHADAKAARRHPKYEPQRDAAAPTTAERTPETELPPSPAAVRMRRSRMRRREGKRTIRFDISGAQIEAMAHAGFLAPAKQDDAAEVERGVGRLALLWQKVLGSGSFRIPESVLQ